MWAISHCFPELIVLTLVSSLPLLNDPFSINWDISPMCLWFVCVSSWLFLISVTKHTRMNIPQSTCISLQRFGHSLLWILFLLLSYLVPYRYSVVTVGLVVAGLIALFTECVVLMCHSCHHRTHEHTLVSIVILEHNAYLVSSPRSLVPIKKNAIG